MIVYVTECEHHWRSSIPFECRHGSLTGTASHPPDGVIYPGLPVEEPHSKDTE